MRFLLLSPLSLFTSLQAFVSLSCLIQKTKREGFGSIFTRLLDEIPSPVEFELPDWLNKSKPVHYIVIKRSILLYSYLSNYSIQSTSMALSVSFSLESYDLFYHFQFLFYLKDLVVHHYFFLLDILYPNTHTRERVHTHIIFLFSC